MATGLLTCPRKRVDNFGAGGTPAATRADLSRRRPAGSARAGEPQPGLKPGRVEATGQSRRKPLPYLGLRSTSSGRDVGAEIELIVVRPGPRKPEGQHLINPGRPAILRNNRPIAVVEPDDHLAAPLVGTAVTGGNGGA